MNTGHGVPTRKSKEAEPDGLESKMQRDQLENIDRRIHFVFGCPRSGTTLLSTIIGRHSRVYVPTETHYVDQLLPLNHQRFELSHKYVWDSIDHRQYLSDMGVRQDDVYDLFKSLNPTFRNLFVAYMATGSHSNAKQFIVEKTPDHLFHYDLLSSWFPDARFVNIVRDPRAVSLSLSKTYWGNPDSKLNVAKWVRASIESMKLSRCKSNVLSVKYEDLITDPVFTMRRVMEFLSLEFEERQLDTSIKISNVADTESAWKGNASSELNSSRVDSWKLDMPVSDAYFIEGYAAGEMKRLGYHRSPIYKCIKGVYARKMKRLKSGVWSIKALIYSQIGRSLLKIGESTCIDATFIGSLREYSAGADLKYRESVTNCALIESEKGYFGVFRNGNFHYYSHDIGVPLPNRSNHTCQKLYSIDFTKKFAVGLIRPLNVNINGNLHNEDSDLLEDVRLVRHQGKIYGTVAYIPENIQKRAEVLWVEVSDSDISCFDLKGTNSMPPQKNWIPFVWNDEIYIQMDVEPLSICKVDIGTRSISKTFKKDRSLRLMLAKQGMRLSGGTPLIDADGSLLGICHAYTFSGGRRQYYSFFYTVRFDGEFSLSALSLPFRFRDQVPIQFAIGIVDDRPNSQILISYGVADCDNYFVAVSYSDIDSLMNRPLFHRPH